MASGSSNRVIQIVFLTFAVLALARLGAEADRPIEHRVGHVAGLLVLAGLAYRFAARGGRLSRIGGILAYTAGAVAAPATGFVLLFSFYFLRWSQRVSTPTGSRWKPSTPFSPTSSGTGRRPGRAACASN
jgi:hypothetical protein